MNYQNILIQLGITPNYTSFYQLNFALELACQDPDSLLLITKLLYPAVAKEFNTTWKAVEHNFRSAINMAWSRNPSLISQIAGYPLPAKPKTAQFIAILVNAGQDFSPVE